MPVPARLSLVTLAVSDLSRAVAFYEALGWRPSTDSVSDAVAFFQLGSVVLSLYPAASLAKDLGEPVGPARGAVNLALNLATEGEVDTVHAAFVAAGGRVVQPPHKAHWGGRIAFVADPDGHVWEIAWNPFWLLDGQGQVVLPP